MKNPEMAYAYARDVIEGRWPETESHIMSPGNSSTHWRRLYKQMLRDWEIK